VDLSGGKMGLFVNLIFLLTFAQFSSAEELSTQLNRWKVQCLDEKNCPDSVAQLLVTDGKNLNHCTATLIAPDIALSNSHCFDMQDARTRRLIDPDQLCRAGSRIVFAENSPSGKAQLRCKKILRKSIISLNYQSPDYVIFQLEKPANRKFDEMTRLGLQDEIKLKIRKVNPVRRGLGNLEVSECQVLHQTLLAPRATTDHYHIHTVTGCAIEGGNSGASLVDDQGLIRGVIFRGVTETSRTPRTDFEMDFKQKALKLKSSLMTNATCIDYELNQTWGYDEPKCLSYQMSEDTIVDALDVKKMKQQHYQELLETARSYPNIESLGYRLHFDPVTKEFVYSPNCIKPILANDMSEYIPNSITLSLSHLFWKPIVSVNSQLRAEVSDFNLSIKKCQITFSPAQFKIQNQGFVQFSGPGCGRVTNQSDTGQEIWSVCQ